MNDLEEVRFGIFNGPAIFKADDLIRAALETPERHTLFVQALDDAVRNYDAKFLLDTYAFCLSEHPRENRDGLLSMWRGYGANGRGVAIVFDTAELGPIENTPLMVAKVHYGSTEKRLDWFKTAAAKFAGGLKAQPVPDDKLWLAANALFERMKIFSLFTKHHGFEEENEWRVVYLPDRDVDGKLKPMFSYLNGPRGVEPKLRFKVEPLDGVTSPTLSLDGLIHSILLGPTSSSPLAVNSVRRMLDVIGKAHLKEKVIGSTIPFRP